MVLLVLAVVLVLACVVGFWVCVFVCCGCWGWCFGFWFFFFFFLLGAGALWRQYGVECCGAGRITVWHMLNMCVRVVVGHVYGRIDDGNVDAADGGGFMISATHCRCIPVFRRMCGSTYV